MEERLKPGDVARSVKGDMVAFMKLRRASHAEIGRIRSETGRLVLDVADLLAVVRGMATGSVSHEQAHEWAGFVRRGYMPSNSTAPVLPFDIDYDLAHEDLVVEVIARLDELGDLVEGVVTSEELSAIEEALRAAVEAEGGTQVPASGGEPTI